MEQDFKNKWIDALRKGKYRQTEGKMYSYGGYCCLGVACIVLGYKEEEIEDLALPSSIQEPKIPIPEELLSDSHVKNFTYMNDSQKLNFNQIADYIEKNY